MTDQGKRMTAEELLERQLHYALDAMKDCKAKNATLESRVNTAEELRDLTTKDRDEFRERAIAAEQRNAALEAENKTLREERDGKQRLANDLSSASAAEAEGLRQDAAHYKDRAEAAEAALIALTRPPSDEEVGKAEKEAARSVRFQLGGPFAVGLSEKERIEFDAKAARLAKVAAAPFTDLIRRLAQANKTAREEGLEEAAVICDAWAKTEPQPALGSDEPTPTTRAIASICRDVGTKCAAAIRALSTQETKPGARG